MDAQVHVRTEHSANGYDTVSTAVLKPEGMLQVTACFAAVYGSDQVIGYQCTLMEARLNGALVTDPDRARRLAARAGIFEPPAMTWLDGSAVSEGSPAAESLIRDILEALCQRDGLSLESTVEPGEPARNYELADRLGIGRVFGLREQPEA